MAKSKTSTLYIRDKCKKELKEEINDKMWCNMGHARVFWQCLKLNKYWDDIWKELVKTNIDQNSLQRMPSHGNSTKRTPLP